MLFLIRSLLLFLLLLSALAELPSESPQPADPTNEDASPEDIKQVERKAKEGMRMERTNHQTYNFLLQGQEDFEIRLPVDQQVRGTLEVYWKQNNVYLMAYVQSGEQIRLDLLQAGTPISSQNFSTAAALRFNATANVTYRLRLTESGRKPKLILMKLSEASELGQKTAKKGDMEKAQEKMESALRKLQGGLKTAELGVLLNAQIDKEVLWKSLKYSIWQILESLFVVSGCWLQFLLLKSLLKTHSIV